MNMSNQKFLFFLTLLLDFLLQYYPFYFYYISLLFVQSKAYGFKWNQLGELYQWFTDTYAHLSLKELMGMLDDNIQKIFTMIDSMTEEELFLPHKRKWADEATKTAVWEVYKFIHVNTVAPFGTFRTKIRKWKKLLL